ncbi:MAG: replication-relaxation family protein [Gammaproteobacteria bacterium]|nr:replication-relaxation family protein [Gammaproteobacteria bacterium]
MIQDDRSHDTLQRRRRDRRQPTGKRLTLQERDLLWLQKIHDHGPLSSSFLHAFSKNLRRNEKRARDRLTDLFNEDRTPDGGAYLGRPWQQFQTFDARYQDLVYDLTPAAESALKARGDWSDQGAHGSGPWLHRYMVASITASIELATLENPSLTYIPQQAILQRAGTVLRHPAPFENPTTKKTETRDLIPDAVFGLEYRKGGERSYRFFIVEADRATEPSRSSIFNRKSHLRTILQYRAYVGEGLYKSHLNLTAGMMVLNVTTSDATRDRMMALTNELSERGNTYLLFQTCDHFGRYFKPPKPMAELLLGDWLRAGHESFRIDRA